MIFLTILNKDMMQHDEHLLYIDWIYSKFNDNASVLKIIFYLPYFPDYKSLLFTDELNPEAYTTVRLIYGLNC